MATTVRNSQSTPSARRCGPGRSALALVMLALALAAPVRSFAVRMETTGSEPLSRETIEETLRATGAAEGAPGALAAAADSLARLYAAEGHPFARVEVAVAGSGADPILLVDVRKGPEVALRSVRLEGALSLPTDELLFGTGLSEGRPVVAADIERAAQALVEAYAEAGRPLATVRPLVERAPDDSVDVTFLVDEGRPVVFGPAVVTGNEATREEVLLREIGIEPGRPFSRDALDRARARLERTGLFSSVGEPTVAYFRTRSEAVPVFEVEEARVNRVLGALGYVPGDDRLSGAVEVALGNIAGTGRRAEVAWERLPGDERRAAFAYVEPWLFGAPIDVGVSGSQTVRDTISTVTEGDLTVSARLGERSRVAWSLGTERYVPGAGPDSPTGSVRTALAASLDAVDSVLNPTRGLELEVSVEYAAKEIDDTGGRERSGTLRAELTAYVPLSFRHTLAFRGSGGGVWSSEDDVPYHEELTLGGASSLRGYREEQFRGVRIVSGSAEYRYLVGRSSRLVAFVDAGHYRKDGPNSATDTKLGYGIGLRGATRFGIIAVDYGLGEGNSLLDGKLHVGFTRAF